MRIALPVLRPDSLAFPDPETALNDPDGLLAMGGDLRPERLIAAYRAGVFPWFSEGQPILWWSPGTRAVVTAQTLNLRRSLRKRMNHAGFDVTADHDFRAVIEACAEPRPGSHGTWITPGMRDAYCRLHAMGVAHSLEVWHDGALVGGLYGLVIGGAYFGESMFSRAADASKVAFIHLVAHLTAGGATLIDCQMMTDHLASLGAQPVPRASYLQRLAEAIALPCPALHAPWKIDNTHWQKTLTPQ